MALSTSGLTSSGLTAHYQFQYDDSLVAAGVEPARTNQVIAQCEIDFALMSGWFNNIALDVSTPIAVNITPTGGGAGWTTAGTALTVTIKPGAGGTVTLVRYLLVSEMVEQFMRAQGLGWFGAGTEGSQGEGLSRFLAAQFLAANSLGPTPAGFANSTQWLASARADFVNNINPTDDGPDVITGCALLFIYYLFAELGFGIQAIVAAGANNLGAVYRNLTGDGNDPFPFFKRLLDSAFPGTSVITSGDLDNPFPLAMLSSVVWHHRDTNETQIWRMDGPRITGRGTVVCEQPGRALVGLPFEIVGVGDLTGDGKADIVWHHRDTNETQIWRMDGPRITGRETVVGEDGNPALVGLPFEIVGVSQLTIVWHHRDTNETQIWRMDGPRITGRATVVSEDGTPALVGRPFEIVGVSAIRSQA
jgi:hypothetical protein